MSFSRRSRAAARSIINCHETGRPIGDYSAVAVLSDGAGISYGSSQATHRSGTLYKIVKLFCDISNSGTAIALRSALPKLASAQYVSECSRDLRLKALLREAGKEPEMRYSQNRVFDRNYLDPAADAAEGSGWSLPLTLAVIFDSLVQGGWAICRDKVRGNLSERDWITRYVATRRNWLANHPKPIVRGTVYRMATFEAIIKAGNWNLEAPFKAHGAVITEAIISALIAGQNRDEQVPAQVPQAEVADYPEELSELHEQNTEGVAELAETEAGVPEAAAEPSPATATSSPAPSPPATNTEVVTAPVTPPAPDSPNAVTTITTSIGSAIDKAKPILEKGADTTKKWSIGAMGVPALIAVWKVLTNPDNRFIIGVCFSIALAVLIFWLYTRFSTKKEVRRLEAEREARQHELELKKLEIALENQRTLADKGKNNVVLEIAEPPKEPVDEIP